MNKLLKKLFNKKNMYGGANNNNNLNIIIIIILVLLFLYIYYHNSKTTQTSQISQPAQISASDISNQQTNTSQEHQQFKKIIKIKTQNTQNTQQTQNTQLDPEVIVPEIYPILREYDYKTLHDPLTPPYKRDDDMIPANVIAPDVFGMYTQGGPLPFIKVGKLVDNKAKNDEPYKFLILFGRRRYPGSNLYDYYATTTNRDDYLKFDLDYKNIRNELYTGNHVFIPELKKKYEVIIDRQMDLIYTPYM
jgi:hypothetical protein